MTDYKGAIWMPCSNFFPNSGKKSFLILHSTAGGSSAQGIANYFKGTEGGSSPVSSHYVIGQDGTVVQVVAEKDGSYANGVVNSPNWTGNPNYYTISIEHCKPDTTNAIPLTTAQKAASFALIKDICQRNGIGMHAADDNTGIASHADIDPINRARCPGTYPWEELWNYLAGNQPEEPIMIDLTNPTVASHFSGTDNTMWTCKDNGFVIGHAILDFYRKFGGDALCGLTYLGLPVSNELPVHGYPGLAQQEFERATVRWDPAHAADNPPASGPVYVIHEDQDPRWLAAQAQIDALKALLASSNLGQISTLGKQIADDVSLIMKLVSVQ
jgi:N-acetylmuramoyl-L-alanine amidase-like protein